MTKKELDSIIILLEENTSKEKASFGLYYRDGEDEMHLMANKDGFELFAAELLKASRDSNEIINNPQKDYIPFGFKESWLDGELISYIKPVAEDRAQIRNQDKYVQTFKDYIFKYVFFLIVGIVVSSIIIGIYTIVNWFL